MAAVDTRTAVSALPLTAGTRRCPWFPSRSGTRLARSAGEAAAPHCCAEPQQTSKVLAHESGHLATALSAWCGRSAGDRDCAGRGRCLCRRACLRLAFAGLGHSRLYGWRLVRGSCRRHSPSGNAEARGRSSGPPHRACLRGIAGPRPGSSDPGRAGPEDSGDQALSGAVSRHWAQGSQGCHRRARRTGSVRWRRSRSRRDAVGALDSERAALIYLHSTSARQRALTDAVGETARAELAKSKKAMPPGTGKARNRCPAGKSGE